MLLVLLLVTLLILAVVFWRYPNTGLVCLIASLPFERLGVINLAAVGQVRPAQIIGAALIGGWLLRILINKQPIRYLPVTKWLLALAIWALVPIAIISFGPLWQDYFAVVFVLLLAWTV